MPTPSPTPASLANQAIDRLDTACRALVTLRGRPMLVMYYPPPAAISELDIPDAYGELRNGGATKEQKLPALDLLLDTYGGDPVSGYRIAQLVRGLTKTLDVLVPENAYSAGTLMSFAGDQIRLGDFAGLSPIDITVRGQSADDGVQLAGIDSYLDFAHKARKKMEEYLKNLGRKEGCSTVDSDLLVQMVKEIGALTVGKYYRERTLTGEYAQILLQQYMFCKETDCMSRASQVIAHFLFMAPAHDFHLDYRLCKEWHLNVVQMPTSESDIAKDVLKQLRICTATGIICKKLNQKIRMPFIRMYAVSGRRRNVGPTQQTRSRRTRNS